LKSKGHIYEGELPPPKGQENEDWVPRRQLLFRTTHLGDDTDRPIQKHDGTWSYFAPDIVYHADKLSRGKDWLINVLGADHAGYEIRLRAAVEAVNPSARFDALFCQLVRLIKNGKPVKMSKREGNFVTLAEVVQAVKADAVRFSVAMRKTDTPHDIDVDLLTAQSRANPVFYVKYAHARCCSVLTKAQGMGYLLPKGNSLEGTIAVAYNHRGEDKDVVFHDLRLLLATWPMVFRRAAEQLAPHHIANYASELAAAFHTLWTLGIKNPEYRILPAMGMLPAEVDSMDLRLDDDPAHDRAPEARDRALEASSSATPASQVPGRATGYDRTQPNQTLFRLLVIDALRIVLASSLETLGMHPPNTM
ncbi:MAG: hypothetical protein K0U36_05730, partial [Alphaproteobacteria bacterium]|nr:hypothetical protein [Alphaproteobacteria bacterium]